MVQNCTPQDRVKFKTMLPHVEVDSKDGRKNGPSESRFCMDPQISNEYMLKMDLSSRITLEDNMKHMTCLKSIILSFFRATHADEKHSNKSLHSH